MSTRTFSAGNTLQIFLAAWVAFSAPCLGQPASGIWTLRDCLSYGLNNHPDFLQQTGYVETALARVGMAHSANGFQFNATSNVVRRRTENLGTSATTGQGKGFLDSTLGAFTLRKTINDGGMVQAQTSRMKAFYQAAIQERAFRKLEVASRIKVAYYQEQQAHAMIAVKTKVYQSFLGHLTKVKGFVEVGNRPPYDITRAEVDVADAKVSLIQAESTYRLARTELAQAVGFDGEINTGDPLPIPAKSPQPVFDIAKLHEEVLRRADLVSAMQRVRSSEFQLVEARKRRKPSLFGAAGYNFSESTTRNRSWEVALNLEVPIFDGELQKHQVDEAAGALWTERARFESLKLAVKTGVDTALTYVADAFKQFEAAQILVQQASESLYLTEGRYDAGIASPIEITDARTSYSKAEGTLATTYFDTLIALARLDLALGRLPSELETSEKLETVLATPTLELPANDIAALAATASETATSTAVIPDTLADSEALFQATTDLASLTKPIARMSELIVDAVIVPHSAEDSAADAEAVVPVASMSRPPAIDRPRAPGTVEIEVDVLPLADGDDGSRPDAREKPASRKVR